MGSRGTARFVGTRSRDRDPRIARTVRREGRTLTCRTTRHVWWSGTRNLLGGFLPMIATLVRPCECPAVAGVVALTSHAAIFVFTRAPERCRLPPHGGCVVACPCATSAAGDVRWTTCLRPDQRTRIRSAAPPARRARPRNRGCPACGRRGRHPHAHHCRGNRISQYGAW